MAKDQFKEKLKSAALSTRFSVFPLLDKGDAFLCVDANFNFLMVKKARLEEYGEMALPETFEDKIAEEARDAAKEYLPSDSKKIEMLVRFLKTKGPDKFSDELAKVMA